VELGAAEIAVTCHPHTAGPLTRQDIVEDVPEVTGISGGVQIAAGVVANIQYHPCHRRILLIRFFNYFFDGIVPFINGAIAEAGEADVSN